VNIIVKKVLQYSLRLIFGTKVYHNTDDPSSPDGFAATSRGKKIYRLGILDFGLGIFDMGNKNWIQGTPLRLSGLGGPAGCKD